MPDRSKVQFYPRVFGLVTVALIAWALFVVLRPFAASIAWAWLAAFLLYPVHVKLTGKLRGRASLSSGMLTFATTLICVGPLAGLAVAFVRQASALVERLQPGMASIDFSNIESLHRIPWLHRALEWLEGSLGVSAERLQGWAVSSSEASLKYFAAAGGSLFKGAIGTVLGFAVMLFLLFFFLRDGANMQARLVRLVPMARARKKQLMDYLAAVTRAVVFGTLLTALIQGALVGIAFLIVGLPSPVVFAVVAAALSLLPLGGTALVWGPATIFLAATDRYGAAIFMAIWGAALVGLIDNFLKPLLISGRAEMPTLAAFLGVLGGLAAFGAVGMFVGPVLLALVLALLRYAEEQRRPDV